MSSPRTVIRALSSEADAGRRYVPGVMRADCVITSPRFGWMVGAVWAEIGSSPSSMEPQSPQSAQSRLRAEPNDRILTAKFAKYAKLSTSDLANLA
jgi:hypothetical protein